MWGLAVIKGGVRLAASFTIAEWNRATTNKLTVGLGALADGIAHAGFLVPNGSAPRRVPPLERRIRSGFGFARGHFRFGSRFGRSGIVGRGVLLQPFAPGALAARRGAGRPRTRLQEVSHFTSAEFVSLSASGRDQPWSLVSSKIDAQTARSA